MIILKISAICPACDEQTVIDIEHPDTTVESCRNDILLSFKCSQCGEYIDREAFEKE